MNNILHAVKSFDDLNTQIYSADMVLNALSHIPYIGLIAKPVSIAIEKVASGMGKSNEILSNYSNETISPINKRFTKTNTTIIEQEAELARAMNILTKLKKSLY